jgi:alkylglycerol monooxygenase
MIYLISAFVIAIVWEVFYAKKHGLDVYNFSATISHLGLGAGQTAINAVIGASLIGLYSVIYHTYHFFDLDENSLPLTAALILIADFCYYFAHRASHRINFFVAAHVVHHQALDFNHGSAIRQSWTSKPAMFLFYAPLAIVGIPLKPLLAALLVNLFLQFFSHNGVIRRKLGILEYIIVTPRAHRVHHGTNAPYLDKNFSGIFIFWDFLFGTYQAIDDSNAVQIGPTQGTNPYDPVGANLSYYRQILFVGGKRESPFGKMSIWFETPETLEAELDSLGYVEQTPRPAVPNYSREAKITILALLAFTVATLIVLMAGKESFGPPEKTTLTLLVLAGAWITGRFVVNPSLLAISKKVRS